MSRLSLRSMLWWLIPLAVTLVGAIIAFTSSIASEETHNLPGRLGNVLIIAAFAFSVGWLTRARVTREKIFGVGFMVLGLFILTAPLRLIGDREDARQQVQIIDAAMPQISEGQTIRRSEVVLRGVQAAGISTAKAEQLITDLSGVGPIDSISFQKLTAARLDSVSRSEGITAYAPEAISGLRYGGTNENAPVTNIPTALWLTFAGLVFVACGLLSLFLPLTVSPTAKLVLTGLALLILFPLVGSVLTAAITVLERTVSLVPGIVWWVLGYGAYLGSTGFLAYRGRERETIVPSAWATVSFILLVPTVLIVVAVGKETNIMTILAESLRLATPIVIGAIAGIWCERSGVINIAIEGMMLTGACIGFTALIILLPLTNGNNPLSLLLAVLAAIAAGGLMALLHAWLSIRFKANQIISGTVINILALGLTGFIRRNYLLSATAGRLTLPQVPIPGLVDIPLIGPVLFNNKPIFYAMFVLLIVTHYVIFHTSWGLRIRAVGEHPHAADTVGINVAQVRYIAVFIGGLVAGLGGAWFTIETAGSFDDNMTSGRGFIALAAMIFGKWTPFGAFAGGMLFGFAEALGYRFQILQVPIPNQFMAILPYVVTMLVLAGFVGRAKAPAADGIPYEK